MLRAQNRLTNSERIAEVVKTGRSITTAQVRIHYLLTDNLVTRISCVAGKKVSAKATVRHKAQRQLRHLAQDVLEHNLFADQAYDMVWIAKPGSDSLQDLPELKKELLDKLINAIKK